MNSKWAVFFSTILMNTASFAANEPTQMLSIQREENGIKVEALIGNFDTQSELNDVAHSFQQEVHKGRIQNPKLEVGVFWSKIDAPGRNINQAPPENLDSQWAADRAAQGLNVPVEEIKYNAEQKADIQAALREQVIDRRIEVGTVIFRVTTNGVLQAIAFSTVVGAPFYVLATSWSAVVGGCIATAILNSQLGNFAEAGLFKKGVIPAVGTPEAKALEKKLATPGDPNSKLSRFFARARAFATNRNPIAGLVRYAIEESGFWGLIAGVQGAVGLYAYTHETITALSFAQTVGYATAGQGVASLATTKFAQILTTLGVRTERATQWRNGLDAIVSVFSNFGAVLTSGLDHSLGTTFMVALIAGGAISYGALSVSLHYIVKKKNCGEILNPEIKFRDESLPSRQGSLSRPKRIHDLFFPSLEPAFSIA